MKKPWTQQRPGPTSTPEDNMVHHTDRPITMSPGRTLPVTQVAHWVLIDPDIPAQSKSLYALLSGHCFGVKTATNVTQGSLAAMMGWSRRQTVAKWLTPLVESGAVDAQPYTCPRTGAQRYTYVIHQTPPPGYARPHGIADWYAANRRAAAGGTGGDVVSAGRVDETAGRDLVRERAHAPEKTDKPDNHVRVRAPGHVRERVPGHVRERAHKEGEFKKENQINNLSAPVEVSDSPGDNDQQTGKPAPSARDRAAAILRAVIPDRWSDAMSTVDRAKILDTATQILAEARHSARARVEDTVMAAMGDDGTYPSTRGRQITTALDTVLQTVRRENRSATTCRNCLPDTPCIMHRAPVASITPRQWPLLSRAAEVSLREIIQAGAVTVAQVTECLRGAEDRDAARYRVARLMEDAGGDDAAIRAWVRVHAPMRARA